MFGHLLATASESNLLDNALIIGLICIGFALIVCSVVACIARMSTFFRYHFYNRKDSSIGLTGADAARRLLSFKGITDVEVKKAGMIRAFIWGNSYAPNKKTIYLRRGIVDKASVTAVTLACQKVGLAEQHHNKDKKYMVYSKLVPYCPLIGGLFIPLVIVALFLDIIIFKAGGVLALVCAIIGLILYVCSFILVILNVPVEKKATVIAMQIMTESGAFSNEELIVAKKLFHSYMVQYVTDMLIAILQFIKFILQVILTARNSKN